MAGVGPNRSGESLAGLGRPQSHAADLNVPACPQHRARARARAPKHPPPPPHLDWATHGLDHGARRHGCERVVMVGHNVVHHNLRSAKGQCMHGLSVDGQRRWRGLTTSQTASQPEQTKPARAGQPAESRPSQPGRAKQSAAAYCRQQAIKLPPAICATWPADPPET